MENKLLRIIQDENKISDGEKKKLLQQFYESFETGYSFEDFLKPFLETLGLTEVTVTKRSGDGGVDLFAIKNGILDDDETNYIIQVKRNKPDNLIAPEKIDALRGQHIDGNTVRLFITTARVSKKAKEDAITKDKNRPVYVIDGGDLIDICIQHQIGFAYRPEFSKDALNEFMKAKKKDASNIILQSQNISNSVDNVRKLLTANDLRARIISIPRAIFDNIQNNKNKRNMSIVFNEKEYNVTFCPSRNMFASVSNIFEDNDLIAADGAFNETELLWRINVIEQKIYIYMQ